MRLVKLHGSLNWYFSGNAESYSEPVYATEPVHPAGGNEEEYELSKRSTFGLVPFIIPPIAEKSTFFKHNLVRSQWLDAASAIWSADRVFCLGYSLPETDVTVRYWLSSRGSIRPIVDFYVVNVDEREEFIKHYKKMLEPSFSIRDRFVSPNAIEKFTEALISDDVPENEDAAYFLKDMERAEVGP